MGNNDGHACGADNLALPYPNWRKKAEMGYLACLGFIPWPRRPAKRRLAAYAILALLDAEPGPRRCRLFKGWLKSQDSPSDPVVVGRVGIPHDRLIREVESDAQFLAACGKSRRVDLSEVFRALYQRLRDEGVDTRPLWRRATNLPWPREEVRI